MSFFFKTPDGGKIKENLSRRHTREPLHYTANNSPKISGLSSAALFSPVSGRVKIGFVGMAAGVGVTTLCFAAAEYLAALSAVRSSRAKHIQQPGRIVTMLELDLRREAPAGRPYDKIGIDRRFAGRDYTSLYRLAAGGNPLHCVMNIDGGIGWALRVPDESDPVYDTTALHRLLNNASGNIILCDISAHGILHESASYAKRDALLDLLADLDHMICVFDPLPSRLLASAPVAETCRAAATAGVPVTNVFNKYNPGVNLREAIRFTGVKEYMSFPAVSAESVYGAEYACRSLASDPGFKTALTRLFND